MKFAFTNLQRGDSFPSPYKILALVVLAGLSLCVYLLAATSTNRLGYPLDDAWIHQTYARNLAQTGQWAFIPGQPSAGSTAPLWSGILSLGYLTRLDPFLWSSILGGILLAVIGVIGGSVFLLLRPEGARLAFWVGLFLVFEWHFVWAAGSGMETLLLAFLVMVVIRYLMSKSVNWVVVGLLVGLSIWVRPDGLTMLGPVLMIVFFRKANWSERFKGFLLVILGTALLVLPYLYFNYWLGGEWWPNTFFAKQAEYAVLRKIPLWKRYISQAGLMVVGAGVLLLLGIIVFIYQAIRDRKIDHLAWLLWLLGFIMVYAWRLPVSYQHGRYLIPAMPVFFVFGLAGSVSLLNFHFQDQLKRVLARVWLISTIALLGVFWMVGGRAYALDVAVIESEMVTTAHWVAENTPPHALIAAHDIGALGYFGQRKLLDLAGLVSPEVIPFIRDEARLRIFLNANAADYLVTFPGWYPELVGDKPMVYTTIGNFSPLLGGENMAVYLWNFP